MQTFLNNEKGFVMVVALMILVILSLIGIAGLDTSMFEEQIAGNDWSAKRTFYKSDGGTELGSELLEYNFSCGPITSPKIKDKALKIYTPNVFHNESAPVADEKKYPSDTFRDLCWPSENADSPVLTDCDVDSTKEHTNLSIFGDVTYNEGSAIQMAAGYEGKGKGAAGGGAAYIHEIHSQNLGTRGNEAVVRVEWRHVVGQEDPAGCY